MKSIESRLNWEILQFYRNHAIPLDSSQLIALSGGCDSVALLVLLHRICPRLKAVYINHNLRDQDELNREISLVRSLTKDLNISLELWEIPRGYLLERVEKYGSSLEEEARKERYNYFETLMEREKIDYLLLGHHGDDQAETILGRFFQGSGPSGLSGIRALNGKKIRPLLRVSKSDLIQYLREKDISWSEDTSNREDLYQRNQIRNIIMPFLKKYFPGIEGSLIQLGEKMSRIDRFLEKESSKTPWQTGNARLFMPLHDYNSLDPAVREYSLWGAVDQLLRGTLLSRGRGRRIPHRFIRTILDGELNSSFHQRGYGIEISVKEGNLVLEKKVDDEKNREKWNFFYFLEREKCYFFYPWMVEWSKISRPDGKSVVLLLEKDEIPQVRSAGKKLIFESHRGVLLAYWDGVVWHIESRKRAKVSSYAVIIREHLEYE